MYPERYVTPFLMCSTRPPIVVSRCTIIHDGVDFDSYCYNRLMAPDDPRKEKLSEAELLARREQDLLQKKINERWPQRWLRENQNWKKHGVR